MRLMLSIFGVPGLRAGQREIELPGHTLLHLKDWLAARNPGFLPPDGWLLAFVNGEQAPPEWDRVTLHEGDDVVLVVPISGG